MLAKKETSRSSGSYDRFPRTYVIFAPMFLARLKKLVPNSVKDRIKHYVFILGAFKFGIFKWLILRGDAKYAYFQKKVYDHLAARSRYADETSMVDHVVGFYKEQNEWRDYDDYLMKYVDGSFVQKFGLDFATGPGRNIVKYHARFKRLDGADISIVNIQNAKENLLREGISFPLLYVNNGIDLADIPSDTYDFVFSTIAMQHICVYDIRFSLLKEFYRVLKEDGRISIQMAYGTTAPNSVPYFANDYAALQTNGFHDTQVSSPDDIRGDLEKIGFRNFEYWIRPAGPRSSAKQREWIYFTALK